MNADDVNAFVEATLQILETTAPTSVKARKPYLKKDRNAPGVITGIIGLSGDFKGTIAVSFSEKLILFIVSTMFGEEMTEINDDISDAVGEISNMISGHVTNKLAENLKVVLFQFCNTNLLAQLIILDVSSQVDDPAVHAGADEPGFMMLIFTVGHAQKYQNAPGHVLADKVLGSAADNKNRLFILVLLHVDARPVTNVTTDEDSPASGR